MLLVLNGVPAHAYPVAHPLHFSTRIYGVQEGLPDPVAGVALQTRDGFVWVGTDNGLARFDGVEFTTYRAAYTPGLLHDTIRCLFEDADGVLWIGTQAGLCSYRGGKFERSVLLDTPVTAVLRDQARRLWIGTRTKGLWLYADGALRGVDMGLRGAMNAYVRALFEDSNGRIWVGVGSGAPLYLDHDRPVRIEGVNTAYPGTCGFAEQPRGTLWFGVGSAVYRLRDGVLSRFGKEQGLTDEQVTSVCADAQGRIWATARELWRLEGADADRFTAVSVSDVDQCRSVFADREGGYWVGTAGAGLARLQISAFETVRLNDGSIPKPTTVAADTQGNVYLGFSTAGVMRMGPDGSTQRIDCGTGDENEVLSLLPTRDGRLWIGRRGALLVVGERDRVEHTTVKNVHALYEDQDNAVWVGTDRDILRWRNGVFEPMNAALGLHDGTSAWAFVEVGERLYIGLRAGGLLRLENGVPLRYDAQPGAPLDSVRSLQPDRDGYLWVGTRGRGLALFRDGEWWSPESLAVPFQGLVSALQLDGAGNVFVGSSHGLFWGRREDALKLALGGSESTVFRRVGEAEGIVSAGVGFGVQPTSAKGPDGRLWFVTRTGVVSVAPDRLVANSVPPSPQILRTLIDGKPAVYTEAGCQIPAGTNTVRIDYTGPSFNRPDRVTFRYRMENQDTDWVEAGPRRSAFYSHLVPGNHRFEVMAANESGVWSSTPARWTIVQHPHVYQTLWFRLAALLAFASSVGLAVWWGTRRRLQRRLAALESERRLSRERGRIARDLHDEIGGSVTKIGYLVDRLEPHLADDRTRRLQQQLSWQTRLLASDLDRVVWSVSPANATVSGLAEFVCRFARTFVRDTMMQCSARADTELPSLPVPPEVQHHVLAVTKEAINNALKHARASGLFVEVTFSDGRFRVAVRDDGCGFDVNHQMHSERNGLSNMRARAQELGGEIAIVSAPGQGTEVVLTIPIRASLARGSAPAP